MEIDTKKIRIWSKNPRYTKFDNVNFQEIGKEDFEADPFGKYKDRYNLNLKKNYLNLIRNFSQTKSMISLLDSLSGGYNSNIDEIIVTISPFLIKNKIFNGSENFYYALEGNRRIFAINTLLDTKFIVNGEEKSTRKIIQDEVEQKYPPLIDDLKKVFENYDDNKDVHLDNIEVKFLTLDYENDDEIWKTLNARHFGQRKGKLNWPRGLVLSAITSRVKRIRNDLNLKDGDNIEDGDFVKMKSALENFTGKEISDRDLQMALWTSYSFDVYNNQSDILENEKIDFTNTAEEGNDEEDKRISDSLSNEELFSNQTFKISSLELATSTIKLLSKNGIRETLAKIIGLDINTKCWMIRSNLSKEKLDYLIIYIINLIKNKKLNTRNFDSDYENEIKKIISLTNEEELKSIIKKDVSKINPENVPVSMIMKQGWESKIDFSKFSESEKQSFLDKTTTFIDTIIPLLNRILNLEDIYAKVAPNLSDPFLYSLVTIWIIELNSIMKNKEVTSIINFPLFVFSSSLRGSGELIMLKLLEKNVNNDIFNDLRSFKSKLPSKDRRMIDKIDLIPKKFEGWINSTKTFEENTNPFVKDVFKLFYVEKIEDENPILNASSSIKKMLIDINNKKINKFDDKYLNDLSSKLSDFLSWLINFKDGGGFSDILNSLMHTPSLLYDIHNDLDHFRELAKEFDTKIDVMIIFIQFILT